MANLEKLATDVVAAAQRFISRSLEPRDKRIAELEAAVKERDHQLQRHGEHLQRSQTRIEKLQARIEKLERQ
jgi:septal ring factor EnvC (AmiA/AmiB activator)